MNTILYKMSYFKQSCSWFVSASISILAGSSTTPSNYSTKLSIYETSTTWMYFSEFFVRLSCYRFGLVSLNFKVEGHWFFVSARKAKVGENPRWWQIPLNPCKLEICTANASILEVLIFGCLNARPKNMHTIDEIMNTLPLLWRVAPNCNQVCLVRSKSRSSNIFNPRHQLFLCLQSLFLREACKSVE